MSSSRGKSTKVTNTEDEKLLDVLIEQRAQRVVKVSVEFIKGNVKK